MSQFKENDYVVWVAMDVGQLLLVDLIHAEGTITISWHDDHSKVFLVDSCDIRHATVDEIAAGHRIDSPCAQCPNVGHKACCCEVA